MKTTIETHEQLAARWLKWNGKRATPGQIIKIINQLSVETLARMPGSPRHSMIETKETAMSAEYMQYKDSKDYTGLQLAQAVAAKIVSLGHKATAHAGPAATDPDDEYTVHVGHVQTTPEGKAAYRAARRQQ